MAKAKIMFGINPAIKRMARGGGPLLSVLRHALRVGAQFWKDKILPGHFEHRAHYLYPGDYTPRSMKYTLAKQKKGRAPGPMRYSGEMRATILGGRGAITPAVGQDVLRVTLILPHARAQNLWTGKRVTKTGYRHDFHRELTAINDADHVAIERVVRAEVERTAQRAIDLAGRQIRKTVA